MSQKRSTFLKQRERPPRGRTKLDSIIYVILSSGLEANGHVDSRRKELREITREVDVLGQARADAFGCKRVDRRISNPWLISVDNVKVTTLQMACRIQT